MKLIISNQISLLFTCINHFDIEWIDDHSHVGVIYAFNDAVLEL